MKINKIIYSIKRGFWYLFHKPAFIIDFFLCKVYPLFSDSLFLKLRFRVLVGYSLDLDNPQSFNEKIQWLKLHDHHVEYSQMVDKYEAKKIVSSLIGPQYVIPTLGLWDSVDEIEWNSLPDSFVIKATNDSGGNVICKDKSLFDFKIAPKKLKRNGNRDYSAVSKEYPYKDVKHRFIAEPFLEDDSGDGLVDYKFFCFDGEVKFLFVATGRLKKDTRFDFYDANYCFLPVINGHPNADNLPSKPKNFDEMKEVASRLSKGIPHVRIDLYNIDGRIYFGEFTFFHNSGLVPFSPQKWDYVFGSFLHLPTIK